MILDVFAGPGGWDEGLKALGRTDVVGIEWDADACRTATAAGHARIQADAETFPLDHLRGKVEGLIMSPPCTDFSTAGKGAGIDGESGRLILTVPRYAAALEPDWFVCEQVPPALPYWQQFARDLEARGYATWAGVLNAADYGVPQTRRRAILIASRVGPVGPPEPTHARNPEPSLFGPTLMPWVSMADALGWPTDIEVVGRRGAGMIERHGDRPATPGTEPYPTVTTGPHRRHLVLDRRQTGAPTLNPHEVPPPTVVGSALAKGVWTVTRPATTVCGDPRIAPPGHHERQMRDSITITVRDALLLQSFRPDYPVHGTKTSQFRQVGNAVPPRLATAILEQFANR